VGPSGSGKSTLCALLQRLYDVDAGRITLNGVDIRELDVDWLRAQISRRGLADQLSVREADLREVDGPYDKLLSIGVLEHAGRDQLAEVIRAHADFLKPGGLGMLHFIGHIGPRETDLFIRNTATVATTAASALVTLVARNDISIDGTVGSRTGQGTNDPAEMPYGDAALATTTVESTSGSIMAVKNAGRLESGSRSGERA
jgi:energy-coupling factor transporter ATP-binding protein EcfA2